MLSPGMKAKQNLSCIGDQIDEMNSRTLAIKHGPVPFRTRLQIMHCKDGIEFEFRHDKRCCGMLEGSRPETPKIKPDRSLNT